MRNDRGFTLMWALIVMVLVGSLSAVTVTRIATMHGAMVADEGDLAALLAADGALATARTTLLADPAWAGDRIVVGRVPVVTTVVRAATGWSVTARAGGSVVLDAALIPDASRPPKIASWKRTR